MTVRVFPTPPQQPEVPYGTTKLAAEWMIKDYARAYGLGYVIFRYFNASGADLDGSNGESRAKVFISTARPMAAGYRIMSV